MEDSLRAPDVTFHVQMNELVGISRRGWHEFRTATDDLYGLCGWRETPVVDRSGDVRRIDLWWKPGSEREGAKALRDLFSVLWPDRFREG